MLGRPSNNIQIPLVKKHTSNNYPRTWFLKHLRLGEKQEDGGEDKDRLNIQH